MKQRVTRWLIRIGLGIVSLGVVLFAALWLTTYHPDDVQAEPVTCIPNAPKLKKGQTLKILSWNVQYMAGKGYVFFYDLPRDAGPDERPSPQAITQTFGEVRRIILEERPDILLLQELDDGAARTDDQDQLARLIELLGKDLTFACHTSAWYWKASFVPHPRIMGSVGMKLATLSKFHISEATRYQLPLMPGSFLHQQLGLKRALQEVTLPIEGATEPLAIMNTHFDAFAQGTDTMQKQVATVLKRLTELDAMNRPWILGGDFNLLPSELAYQQLPASEQASYRQQTELKPLLERYPSVPPISKMNGPQAADWFTYFSNDPAISQPDRTIDYVFVSKGTQISNQTVRRHDTLKISDHLPVILSVKLN